MTRHQSIHNTDDSDFLLCSSIDGARFHISCPWFRSSQFTRPKLGRPILLQTTETHSSLQKHSVSS